MYEIFRATDGLYIANEGQLVLKVMLNDLFMAKKVCNLLNAFQQSVQSDELACDDIYHDFLLQWEEVNFCDVCGTPIRR